jgi:hypothetical protein
VEFYETKYVMKELNADSFIDDVKIRDYFNSKNEM